MLGSTSVSASDRPSTQHESASTSLAEGIEMLEKAVYELEIKLGPALSAPPPPQESPVKGIETESDVAIVSNLQHWSRRLTQLHALVCQIHNRCAL